MIGRYSFPLASLLLVAQMAVAGDLRAETAAGPPAPVDEAERPGGSADSRADAAGSANETLSLLPLLVPLREQKQLAAELETLLASGDIEAAEQKLNVAIEVGTLASIVIDWLSHPGLLRALQALPEVSDTTAPAVAQTPSEAASVVDAMLASEAVDRERQHAAALAGELETVKADLAAARQLLEQDTTGATQDLIAASVTVTALQEASRLHEDRAQTLARKLDEQSRELADLRARSEIAATSAADTVSLRQALRQEEGRARSNARALASAQQELEALRADGAQQASAALRDLTDTLVGERARADSITRELAILVDEMQALRLSAATASRVFSLQGVGLGVTTDAAAGSLAQVPAVTATGTVMEAISSHQAASGPMPGAAADRKEPDDRLTIRADQLFRSGDVSGARLLLERAQEEGNARAIFLLAETFDPHALAGIGAVGMRGDPGKARELYGRAAALGVPQAIARIDALR